MVISVRPVRIVSPQSPSFRLSSPRDPKGRLREREGPEQKGLSESRVSGHHTKTVEKGPVGISRSRRRVPITNGQPSGYLGPQEHTLLPTRLPTLHHFLPTGRTSPPTPKEIYVGVSPTEDLERTNRNPVLLPRQKLPIVVSLGWTFGVSLPF